MKWLPLIQRLPISQQLGLGLGIILFLVILLGVVAGQQAESLWQETQGMYDHPLQVRRAVGEIQADILAMYLAMREASEAEDEATLMRMIQQADHYETDAHRQFSILYERYLGPRSDIEVAERTFVEWKAIRDEIIRLTRADQRAEAAQLVKTTGAGGRHIEKMLAALQTISQFSINRADRFYATAQEKHNALRQQLIVALSGILVVALAVSIGLLRNILEPLYELTAITDRYRRGQFDARSRFGGQPGNEFDRLAAAFNALADTIQTEIETRTNATRIAKAMVQEEELEGFGRALLTALAEHTGSQMAALYLRNQAKTAFEHCVSIGMDAAGRAAFDAAALEGEFGLALATQRIQHIADIPEQTRFTFAATGGDFRPQALLTIPILAGQEVVALISLASLRPYSATALQLVNDIWDMLNARLNGVLAFRQIHALSDQLERQNHELEAQTTELTAQATTLVQMNAELEQQKQQLDEANRLKNRFLSNVSHELRTPLNSIIALAELLGRRLANVIPPEEDDYLGVIEHNGKLLLDQINSLLDLARIESGREEVTLAAFSVHDLIAEVVEMIEPQARERGIALVNEAAGDLPVITSDRAKCRHILQNLIANAVKFTEVGQVTVAATANAESIQIAVRDTGIGIAADQLPFIFDEFRQADEGIARRYGGVGLGLAIAKKYAMMLGGDITVESAPGRGSTFTLILPPATRTADGPAPAPEGRSGIAATRAPGAAATPSLAGRRILLVEDNEVAIAQMQDILLGEGYQVTVARNGREALTQIALAPPDAMILDLVMPEVDGFTTLQTIRNNPDMARLPVLILTAKHLTQEELGFLKSNHIQQLIRKGDVRRAELLAAVAACLTGPESGLAETQEC